MLKAKSEATIALQNFCFLVENQIETKIKTVHTDNGREFQMPIFYQTKGILHQLTCVSTPQQNVLAKWKHQHILNVARDLKFQSGLSMKYWNEFGLTTVYLINQTPTPKLNSKSPIEITRSLCQRNIHAFTLIMSKEPQDKVFSSLQIKLARTCCILRCKLGKLSWYKVLCHCFLCLYR